MKLSSSTSVASCPMSRQEARSEPEMMFGSDAVIMANKISKITKFPSIVATIWQSVRLCKFLMIGRVLSGSEFVADYSPFTCHSACLL